MVSLMVKSLKQEGLEGCEEQYDVDLIEQLIESLNDVKEGRIKRVA